MLHIIKHTVFPAYLGGKIHQIVKHLYIIFIVIPHPLILSVLYQINCKFLKLLHYQETVQKD